jgi:hypothetical protein
VIATFFGARYMVTIAAIEAFRMVGFARTRKSYEVLCERCGRAR